MGHPQDHFSGHASAYHQFRPTYPASLFAALAAGAPSREAAWDVGCGNGQASVALAAHFATVFATDMSAQQIASADAHPRVQYRVAPAEESGLAPRSIDLVLVAQALHWFDF
jgi:2-polyprenyl-3-methyl-5-hydroxy-6-metoxy-1,4-benzoquinol methylase